MSLQLAAQHMASKGRGPDTTLVHMAPQEVAGLQALAKAHGGSLTLNPDTGLPEAGFLSKILPLVAGAFLGPAGLGLTAMQAGMAAGALGTVATGSLKKGLMAGLGAYGGAGLAGSVMGAGTSAGLGAAAGEATLAGDAAAQAAQAQASSAVIDPLSGMEAAGLEERAAAAGMYSPTYGVENPGFDVGLPSAPPTQAGSMVSVTTPPPAIPAPTSAADQYAQMRAAGFSDADIAQSAREFAENTAGTAAAPFSATTQKALSSPLSAGFDAFKADPSKFMTKENLQYGLAGLSPMMMQDPQRLPEKEKLQAKNFNFAYNQRANPNAGYTGAQTGERLHFDPIYTPINAAGGGLMDIGPVESMSRSNQSQMAPAYAQGGVSDMAVDPYTGAEAFAKGGISNLGDYSDGGRLLKGPGDGVSDSIPATIADKRPARLADGEFVVPARIVSELGNGSTEAGARKLYAMMDRVQKARKKSIGKNQVAVNSRAENLLPA